MIDHQRRAEAAEKTVAVLKARVQALLNGSHGIIDRQLERARLREERNRQKRELMAMRTVELERHNARLEGEVAERTRALAMILDNVGSGLLVVGADHRIREGATRSCRALLGVEALTGQPFAEVVASGRAAAALDAALGQVFDDVLPEEVSLFQLPSRVSVGGRRVEARARTIRDGAGRVEAILFTLEDVTALEEARREAQENAALIGILKEQAAFANFLVDAREEVRLAYGAAASPATRPILRRLLHTLKGNAASFGLVGVQLLIHEIEEETELGAAHVHQVEAAFREFLSRHQAVLGLSWDEEAAEVVALPAPRLEALRKHADAADTAGVRAWVEGVHDRPAAALLGPIDRLVRGLATRLGKSVRLEVVGGDVVVDPAQVRPVFRNLGHLLRNAIDHGIEAPHERGSKPAESVLRVTVERTRDGWRLRVADDGRGVDDQRLVDSAIARGLLTAQQAAVLTRDDRVSLVFVDGLTTAGDTTDISGRGVGMAAVRQAVREVQGTIVVNSACGQGTEIVIEVPARPAAHPVHALSA